MLARPRKRTAAVAVTVAAVTLLGGSYAFAGLAPEAGDGRLRACVNVQTGAMRSVDTVLKCRSGETWMVWNAKGQTGAQGKVGETGAVGATGATGASGATGAKGDTGAAGQTGAAGITGLQGERGAPGLAGADGLPGESGTNGTNGVDGEPGAPGEDGTNGTNGVDGEPGAPGEDGTNGANGTNGINGTNGTNTTDVFGLVTDVPVTGGSNWSVGFPSGVSVAIENDNITGIKPHEAIASRSLQVSGFTARLAHPADASESQVLLYDRSGVYVAMCTVPVGQTSCTSSDIGTVPQGHEFGIHIKNTSTASTEVQFSYSLTYLVA